MASQLDHASSPHPTESQQQASQSGMLWERIIGIVGMILVLGAIGFMIYEGTQSEQPPQLMVYQEDVLPYADKYLVQVRVVNAGETTAAQVTVEGELALPDPAQPEVSTATFDYLPPNSSRQGGLIFTHDPTLYPLTLRSTGFIQP